MKKVTLYAPFFLKFGAYEVTFFVYGKSVHFSLLFLSFFLQIGIFLYHFFLYAQTPSFTCSNKPPIIRIDARNGTFLVLRIIYHR